MTWGAGARGGRVWAVIALCIVGVLFTPALVRATGEHGAAAVTARKHARCKVPKLKGDSIAKARRALRQAHCAAGKVRRRSSSRVRKGHVISSRPRAGAKRKAGTKVRLIVSSGHRGISHGGVCQVPSVTGLPLSEATALLKLAHCMRGKVNKKPSPTVPSGFVVSTNPKAGKKSRSGRVDITVSSGHKGPKGGHGPKGGCTVPNVAGQQLASAEATLTSAHCTIGKVKQKPSNSVPNGDVISTNPKAGKKAKGGKVDITVSEGPGCTVPNVVGLPLADAESALTKAHCAIGKVTQKSSKTVAAGDVVSTNPKAGKTTKPGTKVDISVSKGPGYSVPKPQ